MTSSRKTRNGANGTGLATPRNGTKAAATTSPPSQTKMNGRRTSTLTTPFPVNFDPEASSIIEELEEDERAAIAIYLRYYAEEGHYPSNKDKYSVLFEGGRELGCSIPLTEEHIDKKMFTDLFPFNGQISFTDAMKRFLGVGNTDVTDEECRETLRWLSEDLTRRAKSDKRIIPSTSDLARAIKERRIVPALGCPPPSYTTIVNHLGPGSWEKIVTEVLKATPKEKAASLKVVLTLDELAQDYRDAFYVQNNLLPKDGVLTFDDLEAYKKEGGVGKHAYKSFFSKETQQGRVANLNNVRRKAELPIDESLESRKSRRTTTRWGNKTEVYAAYMLLWKRKGLENDPPTSTELKQASGEQTPFMDLPEGLRSRAAIEANVPTVAIPNLRTVQQYFKSMTQLLGYVEKTRREEMVLSNGRVEMMANYAEDKGLDLSEVPLCVENLVRTRQGLPERTWDARMLEIHGVSDSLTV